MSLVGRLVFAKETELNAEYEQFLVDKIVKKYSNFMKHMEGYWKHKNEWDNMF